MDIELKKEEEDWTKRKEIFLENQQKSNSKIDYLKEQFLSRSKS